MARCPYGPHRLILASDPTCKRCGGDLRLYVAVRDLPIFFYNQGRHRWDQAEFDQVERWLQPALALREDFPEAHWLLGLVEIELKRPERARFHLSRARELGAPADPAWADVLEAEGAAPEILTHAARPVETLERSEAGDNPGGEEPNAPIGFEWSGVKRLVLCLNRFLFKIYRWMLNFRGRTPLP
jgi:tetratricopeptide (TPR) repeat protein